MKNKFPTCLVILDGVGYREESDRNAVTHACTPTFSHLLSSYPWTTLQAAGNAIGLPAGYPGNSEMGHLTMGCGAVIKQPVTVLEEALRDNNLLKLPAIQKVFKEVADSVKTLHVMGLLSENGAHASSKHLFSFLVAVKESGIKKMVIHPFLDTCEFDQPGALQALHQLETIIQELGIGVIGSIHGRFYAMDRNKNWHLTEQSYRVLTEEQVVEKKAECWQTVLEKAACDGIAQDCIEPVQLYRGDHIKPGDSVLFFNFRADRARQLAQLFIKGNGTTVKPIKLLHFITPISYGSDCPTTVLFPTENASQTLIGMLDLHGYTTCTVAETEKHAQVTYFFNGGREEKFLNETRVFIPSAVSKKSEVHFAMQAETITKVIVESLNYKPHDFYLINYANADVMAHTGNFEGTVQAVECIDKQLAVLFEEVVVKRNGVLCITGDHGNAEDMSLPLHEKVARPHTTNPVYFLVVKKDLEHKHVDLPLEQLSDIAPFIAHVVLEEN